VREVQKAKSSISGPNGGLYYAAVSFTTSKEVPAKSNIVIVLPPGLSVDDSSVTLDKVLIGEYSLSQQGRVVSVQRSGSGDVIPAGKTIQMLIGRIAVSDKAVLSPNDPIAVSVQFSQSQKQGPDLLVSDIYLESDVVTIVLQNNGSNIDTKDFRISIKSDGELNRDYLAGTLSDKRFLSANGTSKIQPGAIDKTTSFTVCVDSTNVITESNESNNCTKRRLDVKQELAQDDVDLSDEVKGDVDKKDDVDVVVDDSDYDKEAERKLLADKEAARQAEIDALKTDHDSDGEIATTGILEIVSPNGGEVLSAGDVVEIKWKSIDERVKNVMLSVLERNKQVTIIADSVPASDRSLLWTVPSDLVVYGAVIRIAGYDRKTDLTVEDSSDGKFEIVQRVAVIEEGKDKSAEKAKLKRDEQASRDSIGSDVDNTVSDSDFIDEEAEAIEAAGSSDGIGSTSGSDSSDSGSIVDVASGSGSGSAGSVVATAPSTDGFNNLIKLRCPTAATYDVNHPCRTVYYRSSLGTRHAFPNSKVFFTWYSGFGEVQIISKEAMANIALGQNVTYRPGVRMVKFQTSDVVYTVSVGGYLRAVETEILASQLYGIAWNTKIDDVGDVFFTDYAFGAPLIVSEDYSASAAIQSAQIINDSL
jgi:hypothetical protein